MSAAYYPQVQKIYVAYYGRPADPAGLQYWAGQLAANGGNLTAIINAFGASTESTALYGGTPGAAAITSIYQQLFNRAPDMAGLTYYTGELTAGRMTAASIALNIANGATGTDATLISNKVIVGQAFTDALTIDGAAAIAYPNNIAAARSLITATTTSAATTGVASTVATIKSGSGGGTTPAAGQTFTLTASADSVIEGQSLTFTVTRSGSLTAAKSLTFNAAGTTNGDTVVAATTADATPSSGVVTFAAGAATATFTISANSDTSTEGLEGLKVSLFDGTTVAASKTILINDDPNAPVPSQTLTLTANADTGSAFTGTSGNDTYNGQLFAAGATGTTINAGDNLNGGAGTDTLQISVTGDIDTTADGTDAHYTISAITTAGIEKILLSNFEDSTDADANVFYNAATATGLATVGLSSSGAEGDTTFSNLGNVVDAEMANGSADLTLSYQSTLLTGTADTQNLTVSNITAGTFTASNGATGYAETLNIVSNTAKNTLTLADNNHKTINVTGDTNLTLTLTDTSNTVTKVDASAFTGVLTLSGLGTTDIAITGGSGNDTVTVANLDSNDTIAGGTGTDTLKTAAAITAANAKNISGFETLEVTGDSVSQAANALSGLTGLSVNDSTAASANGTITFSSAAGTETLFVKSVGDATDDVALTLATDTASDATTVTLGSTTAGVAFDDLTLDNTETITINNSVGTSTVATLISSDATKLVINASKALTITDALSAAALGTIDASGSTANVTVVTAAAKASNVTGGSGNDNVTGSSAADTISGGAGNDTLAGGTGNDSIDGGAGNDSLTAGAGNDILVGGDGNDIFVDAAGDNDTGSAGVTKADGGAGDDTFTVADFSDLASTDTISGGDGADTLKFTENTNHDFTADITILSNVTSVETFEFSALAGANDTVTVNDAVVSAAGGTLTAKFSGTSAGATLNASGVTSSSSKVVFTDAGSATAATYSIGNGVDSASMSDGSTDTVVISNNAYLSANDTLDGGSGADTLSFTYDTASTQTITSAQLANVKGFETFSIDNGTDATLVNYVLTLDDTIVGNQVASGATFTITRGTGDDGTTKITASSVTSSYNLALNGGDGADTLIGGAGADTILGESGADSLTGGAGNDTFEFSAAAANGLDTITDFDFGTSTTSVDILKISTVATFADLDTVQKQGTTASLAADTDVFVLNAQAYADLAAVETAIEAMTATDQDIFVIWQDTLGVVHASVAIDDGTAGDDGNDFAFTDVAKLVGLTITGVATAVNIGDFA